jgi:hypothetical protein
MTMAVCVFVILFLSLLALLSLNYFKRELKRTLSIQQMTLVAVVAQGIDQKLISAQKALVSVSRELAPRDLNDQDAVQQLLDNRSGTRGIFDHGLTIISKEGRIIAETPYFPGRRRPGPVIP